jgi:hypothetical protein
LAMFCNSEANIANNYFAIFSFSWVRFCFLFPWNNKITTYCNMAQISQHTFPWLVSDNDHKNWYNLQSKTNLIGEDGNWYQVR